MKNTTSVREKARGRFVSIINKAGEAACGQILGESDCYLTYRDINTKQEKKVMKNGVKVMCDATRLI